MPNRLSQERSPYLKQHQFNPVDWYPWGAEAFERAEREDKPIFLSVGYSSCHWCHVMEHESFEDPAVAALLNASFVCVKVDREERPDVDEAFMVAVQMQSGRGGWPMSVFMRPDKKPFFAGTYFPKEDRGQLPGFISVIHQVGLLWRHKRETVDEAAEAFAAQIEAALTREAPLSYATLDVGALESAVFTMADAFDTTNGGFAGAPKFPPHTGIQFLLEFAEREAFSPNARALARQMAVETLEKMALGGLHDHVGGGFHRYSTDERWFLPHFEKMLYDNALILANLSRAANAIQDDQPKRAEYFRGVAASMCEWLIREMSANDGTFFAALDADVDGHEGATYVWSMDEVIRELGAEGEAFAFDYGFEEGGNFLEEATQESTGTNLPYLKSSLDAAEPSVIERLRAIRNRRRQPDKDDKRLIGWNGLMIWALVEAGEIAMAKHAADAILQASMGGKKLPRYLAGDEAYGTAFLEDVAGFAMGLLALAAQPDGAAYRKPAQTMIRDMVGWFHDPVNGAFFATASSGELPFGRFKPVFDQPVPSGNALALRALLAYESVFGNDDYREHVERTLASLMGWMERAPMATEGLLTAGLLYLERSGGIAAGAGVQAKPKSVSVLVTPREWIASPDGWAEGAVTIILPENSYVHGPNPSVQWMIPTKIEAKGMECVVDYPEATEFGYESDVRIPVKLRMSGSKDAEEAEISVTCQCCTESECLAPETFQFGVIVKAPGARL